MNDFVLGGPGNAADVVRSGFTWTFNEYPANLALVEWLRAWNRGHPARPVRFYGADVSGGDEKDELGRAAVLIDELDRYLDRYLREQSAPLRQRLAPFKGRFNEHAYHAFSPTDKAEVKALARDLGRFLEANSQRLSAGSSPRSVEWAKLMAGDVERLRQIFEVWPVDNPSDLIANLKVVALRDRAMADYVLWALHQEGPRGRLLTFAANGHINKTGFRYPDREPPKLKVVNMGTHLNAALGSAYRVILTVPGRGYPEKGSAGELPLLLQKVSGGPFLLDLRKSPIWWRREHEFDRGRGYSILGSPARAADALLFLGPITLEPTTLAASPS